MSFAKYHECIHWSTDRFSNIFQFLQFGDFLLFRLILLKHIIIIKLNTVVV